MFFLSQQDVSYLKQTFICIVKIFSLSHSLISICPKHCSWLLHLCCIVDILTWLCWLIAAHHYSFHVAIISVMHTTSCDFLQSLIGQVFAYIKLIELENNLESLIEVWCGVRNMGEEVIFNKATEKLQEYQDLTVQSKFANNFKKLQSFEFKYFNFLLASLCFLSNV